MMKWGECDEGEIKKLVYLPCAGITLTRFYGYHLSHSVLEQHPEESEICSRPVATGRLSGKDTIFWVFCNF